MLKIIDDELEKKLIEQVKKLTLKEKIGQLVQFGRLKEREFELIRNGEVGSFLNLYGKEKVNDVQKLIIDSPAEIPLLIGDDVIHGFHTTFPIPLAESCSWDLSLIEETSAASAREAASEGINLIFAPMVDIARDPRWGRVAEGAGEDHFLGAKIAEARVKGIQRNDWENSPHVSACLKHFIGYGAAEGGRDYNSVDVSERTLREVYLPPFQAGMEAGAGAIMCSFNDLNGIPSSVNKFLFEELLREELSFPGIVISDWESIKEVINHGIAHDKNEAALKAFNAGIDIDMHSGLYSENLAQLVETGEISEEKIDKAVLRILKLKHSLRLFDHPYAKDLMNDELWQKHRELARQIAEKSIVLLKNEPKLLPLNQDIQTIALIGPFIDDQDNPLGCWSGKSDPTQVISILTALKKRLPNTEILFAKGSEISAEIPNGIEQAIKFAKKAEVVVMALGESKEWSGENRNRAFLDIPLVQKELLKAVYQVNQNIILVLLNGRPLTLSWEDEHIPAIIEAWHLGVESGTAITNLLLGDVNPSGKLTITFPRSVGQIPIYYNHKNTGRPNFPKYLDEKETPLYPFGYGLSYTTFFYGDLRLSTSKLKKGETLEVKVTITNTGDYAGEEIVQLYIQDVTASVTRPVKELKGFTKIYLRTKESKEVTFKISEKDLLFYDENFNLISEPGLFRVWVAPNSREGLMAEFNYLA